jgi:hypothetical protein
MKEELSSHKLAYFILITILLIFIVLFLAAWPNRLLQRYLAICIAGFYLCWGLITHIKAHHLSKRIFFEYLCVSILAGLLLFLVSF